MPQLPMPRSVMDLVTTLKDACDTFVRKETGQPIVLSPAEAERRLSRILDLACPTDFEFQDDVPAAYRRALGLVAGLVTGALTRDPAQPSLDEVLRDHS